MKNREKSKNTQPEKSKRGKKVEKREKNPAGGKQAGEKVENAEKTQPEKSKRGEKLGKVEKNPTRGKQAG